MLGSALMLDSEKMLKLTVANVIFNFNINKNYFKTYWWLHNACYADNINVRVNACYADVRVSDNVKTSINVKVNRC